MNTESLLFLGVKGSVVCIRKLDGAEMWRKHLIGRSTTSVYVDDGYIYAGTRGRLFKLDMNSGEVLWTNKLPKLGYGLCLLGAPNQSAMASIHIAIQQQLAAAAAANAAGASAAAASGSS